MTENHTDRAALYQKHRDAMYRVAAKVLREGGAASHAEDAVQDAMVSLMSSPPSGVESWEAVMVTAAKRKALDWLRSAGYRHAGPELEEAHDKADESDKVDDAEEAMDRNMAAARAWDALAILDDRDRKVVWEYVALERSRAEIASELGVSPARVSQIASGALQRLREHKYAKEGTYD